MRKCMISWISFSVMEETSALGIIAESSFAAKLDQGFAHRRPADTILLHQFFLMEDHIGPKRSFDDIFQNLVMDIFF